MTIIHRIHHSPNIGQRLHTGSPHVGGVHEARVVIFPLKKMTSVKDVLKPATAITVSDISQKGKARIANISDGKGKPIKIVLSKECSLRKPWAVSAFDGGDRCSLDIIMNSELEEVVAKIDDAVYRWIAANPTRYFKTPPRDFDSWYKSPKKASTKEGYANTLRTKCTIGDEKASFKCWDGDKKALTISELRSIDWPSSSFACEVALKGVYFQANTFGPMIEVTNVMIRPEDASCPFDPESD